NILSDKTKYKIGNTIAWQDKNTTNSIGNTIENILARLPSFIAYLLDRNKQRNAYKNKIKKIKLSIGDHVLILINKNDRSNICPKNIEAKIIQMEGDKLWVGTQLGKIDSPFLKTSVHKSIKFSNLTIPDKTISIITASRSASSYGNCKSICNCQKSCNKKRCQCFKNGINCSTKCHLNITCNNK
ncbi:unnamed protein product, partial [Gordionus sp. m RMFG-2023]